MQQHRGKTAETQSELGIDNENIESVELDACTTEGPITMHVHVTSQVKVYVMYEEPVIWELSMHSKELSNGILLHRTACNNNGGNTHSTAAHI